LKGKFNAIVNNVDDGYFNPLSPELNPICYLPTLLAHDFLHVSRIRVKSLTLRLLMSCIYDISNLRVNKEPRTTAILRTTPHLFKTDAESHLRPPPPLLSTIAMVITDTAQSPALLHIGANTKAAFVLLITTSQT
jgi:hypothetical protein